MRREYQPSAHRRIAEIKGLYRSWDCLLCLQLRWLLQSRNCLTGGHCQHCQQRVHTREKIYSTDCSAVSNVLAAVKAEGIQLFASSFNLSTIPPDTQTIIAAADGDWSNINNVGEGSELASKGLATAAQVVATIAATRSTLRGVGFTGSVVTSETLATYHSNPTFCTSSDYCSLVSILFYSGAAASGAGAYVSAELSALQSNAGTTKAALVTEVGWLTKGKVVGAAVPSTANQAVALASIKSAITSVIFYEAFTNAWASPGSYDLNQYWGILD